MFKTQDWHICNICNKTIKELADAYQKKYNKKNRTNYSYVFKNHLEIDHSITLDYYFKNKYSPPICPCGVCNKNLKIIINSSNFRYSKYACGRNDGVIKWSLNAKNTRTGNKNPMYGQIPWNKGKTKNTNNSLKKVSEKHTGKKISEKTKQKQSESAKKRLVHGHTGCKHSEQSKEKMRQNTLKLIKEGFFKQLKSKCFIDFGNILSELNIKYESEYIIDVWSFDYYLPEFNIYIEVDGDYYHSNPKFYPDGPKTNTQKINYYRDLKKNNYCKENNIILYRFWENDILNYRNEVIWNLKKLLGLKV